MTNNKNNDMIDPADVLEVIDRHSLADENTDCKSVLDDVLSDLQGLLPRDCQEDMLGLWAEHPEYGRVLVCSARPDEDGEVAIAYHDDDVPTGTMRDCVDTSTLSFPEQHPETIITVEDYANAPEGTILDSPDDEFPIVLRNGRWIRFGIFLAIEEIVAAPRRVLRWGWVE